MLMRKSRLTIKTLLSMLTKFVKEGRDSLGKLSDSNKKLTDAIKCHKANGKELKSRLRAAESLAAKRSASLRVNFPMQLRRLLKISLSIGV